MMADFINQLNKVGVLENQLRKLVDQKTAEETAAANTYKAKLEEIDKNLRGNILAKNVEVEAARKVLQDVTTE